MIALNKSDLPTAQQVPRGLPESVPRLSVSALSGAGLEDLERALVATARGQDQPADPQVSNRRQRDALRRAESALAAAIGAEAAGLSSDVVAGEVAAAVRALGEITGENATEDLLDAIFSRFCLGK